jgi:hypothetical protein
MRQADDRPEFARQWTEIRGAQESNVAFVRLCENSSPQVFHKSTRRLVRVARLTCETQLFSPANVAVSDGRASRMRRKLSGVGAREENPLRLRMAARLSNFFSV